MSIGCGATSKKKGDRPLCPLPRLYACEKGPGPPSRTLGQAFRTQPCPLFPLSRVALEDLGQALGKRGTRQHHIAAGFLSLLLQLALDVCCLLYTSDAADDL